MIEESSGMRASRLLTVLMLLQARGRMSARALAREVEVSVRTVYRDIDQLSAAGVPVVVERGSAGGFHLLDGWRTRLTGLTPKEAQALLASSVSPPVSQLGLGEELDAARLKLLAALPEGWQSDAQRVSSRFHVDPVRWYAKPARADFLQAAAEAVWASLRIRLRYESWSGAVERDVEPLGLVLKAGAWYLVAGSRKPCTYRVSSILALTPTRETFRRPPGFDLAKYWTESTQRFEREIYRGTALVRVSPRGKRALCALSAAVADAVERASGPPDAAGWTQVTLPIEDVDHAAREMLKLGAEVEVLEPRELREKMIEVVKRMATLYAHRRPSGRRRRKKVAGDVDPGSA
jgi:predicted DNA-binding transcriptional regulator YafY